MPPTAHPSAPLPRRFRALDAWRGLCALLVALFHVPVLHPFKDAAAFANLQVCVDFFVLSGFVLSHAYRDRLADAVDGADFMLARFWRLWPLHGTVLAAYVGLEAVKLAWTHAHPGFTLDAAPFSSGTSAYEFATNFVFLQAFGLHPGVSWNAPAWSIAVESWTSAVFALVVVLLPRARAWAFAALVVGAALVLLAASPATLFVTHDWGFARCLLGFFTGCLVYQARPYLPAPRAGLPELAWTGLAVALVALVPQGPLDLVAPLVFAGLVHAFSFERGAFSRVLKGAVPQALGRWSFALYMTHALVFQLVRTAATAIEHRQGLSLTLVHGGDKLVVVPDATAAVALALGLTLCLALPMGAFAHRFIERPLSRLGAPRQVRPAVIAAVR